MGVALRKDSRALEHASYAGLSEKWVSACDLKNGDKVLLSDGTLCEVERVSCKKLSEPETTYNLEVADFHTYYVSDACVLVHNLDCGKVHGNSLRSTKKTDLYALVDKTTGQVKKIGETSRGLSRYTKGFYQSNNLKMRILDTGSKRSMHYQQHRLLKRFFKSTGHLPDLNKGFW